MPHSSGGGSHSSGSSFHSGGGSHNLGGSSSQSNIRKSYYQGSSRYVYYCHGTPHYFYSDRPPVSSRTALPGIIFSMLFLSVFVAVGIYVIVSSIHLPQKLTGATDTNIVISDKMGVIENVDELHTTLESFADKTGVIPMVVTVSNEEWQQYYADLESYAYDRYLNMCDDEYHWLIVYSQPQSPDEQFVDWHWEGMQGDSTDAVLNDTVLDKFNDTMQKELTKTKGSVDSDIKTAFDSIASSLNSTVVNWSTFGFGCVWIFFTGFMIIIIISTQIKGNLYAKAEQIPLEAKEQTCEYCGGKYIVGTRSTCPHCGATILHYETDRKTVLNGEAVNSDNL